MPANNNPMNMGTLAGASHQPMDMAALTASTEASKAAAQQTETMIRLTKVYGSYAGAMAVAQRRNDALGKSMRDGSAIRAARDMAQLNREAERYRRETELTARYGRAGGFYARHEQTIDTMNAAASKTMNTVNGLYNRGMSGTVEQGQRDMEMNLLGKEVAGIFKPLSDATTDVVRGFRKLLGGLGEGGQKALMDGGMGAAGLLALRGGAAGKLALGAGAMGAGAAGGMDAGGILGTGLLAMQAKSMYDARRAATPAPPAMPPLAEPATPKPPPKSNMLLNGGILALGALALGSVPEAIDGGYYEDQHKKLSDTFGDNMLSRNAARLAAFGGGLMNTVSEGTKALGITDKTYGEAYREMNPVAKEAHEEAMRKRNKVTPQGGGFQELGSGYDQLAEGFGKVYGGGDTKKDDGMKEVTGLLGKILDIVGPAAAKVAETDPAMSAERGGGS